ncbi:MAG: hypothetical protein DRN27_06670 [Thermoplasmata archaeon]|nr:MAG: hypothetical protein DRN27_06670 [Thermoplasmata archaeon]
MKPFIDGQDYRLILGEWYDYTISSLNDVNGGNLSLFIDWGDGTNTGWIGPYVSGDIASIGHSWDEYGQYYIRVKVRDSDGLESNWGELLGPLYFARQNLIWDWLLYKILPNRNDSLQ